MKKPKMILFDYGQTLVNEQKFDGVKGTQAVLNYAIKNRYNKTAEEVQGFYFTFPPDQQIFLKENGEWKSYTDYVKVYAIITDADGRSTRVNLTGYSG